MFFFEIEKCLKIAFRSNSPAFRVNCPSNWARQLGRSAQRKPLHQYWYRIQEIFSVSCWIFVKIYTHVLFHWQVRVILLLYYNSFAISSVYLVEFNHPCYWNQICFRWYHQNTFYCFVWVYQYGRSDLFHKLVSL